MRLSTFKKYDKLDFKTIPLESIPLPLILEGIGFEKAAGLIGMKRNSIYTAAYTGFIKLNKLRILLDEIRKDEAGFRSQLIAFSNIVKARKPAKKKKMTEANEIAQPSEL